jgi:hypothetical protein
VADNIIDINDMNLVMGNMDRPGRFYEHTVRAPLWDLIVEELLRCQDVVLLIAPWWQDPASGEWYRMDEGGHFVTVAGLNATTMEIVLSDPINDNAEIGGPGNVPVPHPPHGPIVHNNATLVSHDMYPVINDPCPGGPLSILGYPGSIVSPDPSWRWQIEAAVITSPYEIAENHDIAVTDITTCKDGCDPMRTVYNDTTMHVNVTVVNNGDLPESFIVTAKADGNVIGTQNVVNLPPTGSTVLSFLWNTSGYAIGNYTLSAVAGPVPGETNIADNTLVDGIVKVTIIGDINGDDKVDMKDIGRAARAFGTDFGDSDYDPNADLNDDHKIDMKDIGTAARHFGDTYP